MTWPTTLRELAADADILLQDLATEIGVSPQKLNNALNSNGRRLTPDQTVLAADVLGLKGRKRLAFIADGLEYAGHVVLAEAFRRR
jgi:hypothetical protein